MGQVSQLAGHLSQWVLISCLGLGTASTSAQQEQHDVPVVPCEAAKSSRTPVWQSQKDSHLLCCGEQPDVSS